MKKSRCNDIEFNQIKEGVQLYKIFGIKNKYEFLENIELVNSSTNEKLSIQITSYNIYNDIDNMLKIVNYKQFGNYQDIDEFKDFIKKHYRIKDKFVVCRVKNINTKQIEILDKKLLNILEEKSLTKFNLGLSGSQVFSVNLKSGKTALLKIQKKIGEDTLKEEYDALNFLYKRIKVPKTFYFNEVDDYEYLLRECVDGTPLYKSEGFGEKLGKELKKLHSLYSKNIKFNKFSTDKLLKNMLDKIDVLYENRDEKYKDYSKEELIKFLKDNKPKDDALIHGDFSLTNILEDDKGEYCLIDLGNLSISTKYFDIYVLIKSFKINHLEKEYNSFLKGYNIKKVEEVYLDWMKFVEDSYN